MEDQAETVSKSETTASVCTFIKPRKRKGMARKGSAVVDSDADLGVVKKMKEVKKVNLYTVCAVLCEKGPLLLPPSYE